MVYEEVVFYYSMVIERNIEKNKFSLLFFQRLNKYVFDN